MQGSFGDKRETIKEELWGFRRRNYRKNERKKSSTREEAKLDG